MSTQPEPLDGAPSPAQPLRLEGGVHLSPPSRARADHLGREIARHRALYYGGTPLLSDSAYDALEDELRTLDPTHPALGSVGSPTLSPEWEKARHELPMGSLNKVVNEDELRAWLARCDELAPSRTATVAEQLYVMEKLDGISLEVIYDGGRFVDGITRGDGDVGERISANVARMKGVPKRVRDPRRLALRGEIILRKSDAPRFPDAVSLRNQAAGVAKRLDGEGAEHLTVLFYDVADELGLATEVEKLSFLRDLGFATPRGARCTESELLALYAEYQRTERGALDYEIDGLVVKVDSLALQAELGELNRRPRGAVAFKFPSPSKVTTVRAITWDTGPSGRVTPVALVEPVELAGATVQRASLHNASNVRGLGIGPGDRVMVSRRNDVIPYVEEVVEKLGPVEQPPSACAACAAAVEAVGEYLLCRNEACPAIVKGRISNWIRAVGALEWGDKLIEQLIEAGRVKRPADLYRLEVAHIAELERRGEKIAKKALHEVRSRMPLSLVTFLTALGIEGFGEQTARLLVETAGLRTLDAVLGATEPEIAAIPGLGALKASAICKGLGARRAEIDELRSIPGLGPVEGEQHGPLTGHTFCFTGSSELPRAELKRLVEDRGGRVLSSVTKELGTLVASGTDATSAKATKARSLGTRVISYDDFLAELGLGPNGRPLG
jgi:DNA ligase (NAD+)